MKKEMDGYDRLAIGIVSLAANDYRAVLRGLAAERSVYERRMLLGQKKELERFFLSDYGDFLCYGRGREIMEQLQKEENGRTKRRYPETRRKD